MARIRTIKPRFWKHEELSELPAETHMLAAALLNYADDAGYFNAHPGLIKAECFPLRELSVSVPESLRSLQRIGFISLGKGDDGKTYGRILTFEDHQKVSHPTPSEIADKSIAWEARQKTPEPIQKNHGIIASGSDQKRNEEEEGNEERDAHGRTTIGSEINQEFEKTFWPRYPVHEGKKPARAAFARARAKVSVEIIMAGLERYLVRLAKPNAPSPKWAQGWLNDERWTDELPAPLAGAVVPASPIDAWRQRIEGWLERGFWIAPWGDAPDSKNCDAWHEFLELKAEFAERIAAKTAKGLAA